MLNYLLVKMLSIVEIIMVFNEEFNIVIEIYYKIKILCFEVLFVLFFNI